MFGGHDDHDGEHDDHDGEHDDHDSDQDVDADEKDGDRVCQDLSRFVNCSPYCTALLTNKSKGITVLIF